MAGVFEVTTWWLVLAALWIASLTTVTWQELAVAAVCSVPCALVARKARHVLDVRWKRAPRWLRWVAALPGAVVQETLLVWRQALRRRDGETREIEVGTRRAVIVAMLSASPGTVVVNDRQSTVVVHAFGKPGPVERAVTR
ncbi:hypothetical protein DMH04_01165 [Kibdelosporangium aridum]|uniref:Uncharacterized protein n=1 Tax=Kibdelosporangium aridum TaxID=2030 RepID=A0A428ZU71_KIBAR|nr:Na+/H+ antiporter subunit E [Kibdelosporangium aridum]RSM91620.1 hypothetical protein DMH04_01165 [Kibdelosporangium aridum]